ncbi:hypothetical protein [Fusobacterium mortiferum]|uniref:Uncharacterized protein n=1 Tax=Fusobacterium mortiferum TaxID=850 RepID=A0ABS2G0M9_FUSMR|nr:hypothetical protein [Fusobacterium mortiferum]MBM6874949.1 hypothetical protein [Fusobacterium mortiferum]
MKKLIIMSMLAIGSIAQASWWGELSGGTRAAIIGGSALILNSSYQNSELKHQRDLDNLDTQIRRDYERQAVIENANRKYSGSGVPARLKYPTANNYSGQGFEREMRRPAPPQQRGKIIFADDRTQIIELSDGTRITLTQ